MIRASDPGSPRNYMEKYFLVLLARADLPRPAFRRSDFGMLIAAWQSPNPEVGEFWAYIDYRGEVTLGCDIAHKHCRASFYPHQPTNRIAKRIAVREGIAFARGFLADLVIVDFCLDSAGHRRCSGWNSNLPSKAQCLLDDAEMARILKSAITQHRHTWSGPYKPAEK